ncbi:hypothetical protein HK44_027820 [Pseudomonas fluorescens HK44]|uniref:Uncharacterized protein n=1 Tax=Pseudomonas fluorescens HK44 TaxID=1042209 RepID=A0A010SVT0_PSEFL|nr:hypothetical protein HK44_027820 [Pseudomonas fluorescens HK44]
MRLWAGVRHDLEPLPFCYRHEDALDLLLFKAEERAQ